MGWLKTLLQGADPPMGSYGELARRALAHPDWPASTNMQARSLAALFSKLDRSIELEWLDDRPRVQHVLAELLGCPLASVRRPVRASEEAATDALYVRLTAFPQLPPIDLASEPLFPGIPERVLQPATWKRTWWRTRPGAGRSLVARWLSARGRARDFARGPGESAGLPRLVSPDTVAELPGDLDLDDRWCVAAPFDPPDSLGDVEVVDSPPPERFIDPLLAWIEMRMSKGYALEASELREWLHQGPARHLAETPGVALELIGAAHSLGVKRATRLSVDRLARAWLDQRFAEGLERGHEAGSWLRRSGYDLLVALARATFTESSLPWEHARSFDEWLTLVPQEYQQSASVEWLKASLADTPGGLGRQLEQAARAIPPGAFRTLRALIDLSLLEPRFPGADSWRLAPRWLLRSVERSALTQLLTASPLEWGEALLRPVAAPRIMATLEATLAANVEGLIESVVDLHDDQSAAMLAAVESLALCVGSARLAALEVTQESATELFEEQLERMLQFPGELPWPRLGPAWSGSRSAMHGAWLLALLSLAEGQSPNGQHPSLFVAMHDSSHPTLGRPLLNRIVTALREHPDQPWALPAFSLVDRIRTSAGSVAADGHGWHALEKPGLIAEEIAEGALTWDSLQDLGNWPLAHQAVLTLSQERRLRPQRVADTLWAVWLEAHCPAIGDTILAPDAPLASDLWPHCPVEGLIALLGQDPPIPYGLLTNKQWQMLRNQRAAAPLWEAREPWQRAPLNMLESSLNAAVELPRAAYPVLWQRLPETLAHRVATLNDHDPARALALVRTAPEADMPRALEALKGARLVDLAPNTLESCRRWLHTRTLDRKPGWTKALALLTDVETRLARLDGRRR